MCVASFFILAEKPELSLQFRLYFEGMSRTYSEEMLREYNAKDIEYNGQRMTEYEALQEQRNIERHIRRWKREETAMKAAGLDTGEASAKVREWNGRYKDFLEQTGLKPDGVRVVAGKTISEERLKKLELKQIEVYNKKQEELKKAKERSEKIEEIRNKIRSDEVNKTINKGAQNKHILSSKGYIEGRSYIFGDSEDAQRLVNRYSGTGEIKLNAKGEWANKEFVVADKLMGMVIDPKSKDEIPTKRFSIHYGKKGTHIVPAKERE